MTACDCNPKCGKRSSFNHVEHAQAAAQPDESVFRCHYCLKWHLTKTVDTRRVRARWAHVPFRSAT